MKKDEAVNLMLHLITLPFRTEKFPIRPAVLQEQMEKLKGQVDQLVDLLADVVIERMIQREMTTPKETDEQPKSTRR